MAESLYDKVIGKDEGSEEKPSNPVRKLTSTLNQGSKDKQISAKVNNTTYDMFTQINKAQGLSNNSALNMLINRYVRENKSILDLE